MTPYTIRPEQPGDEAAIYDLVARAFAPMPFSEGDEQDLVNALRRDGDLIVSLVAADPSGAIIGHIGFSPATINQQQSDWFQMAPVSVSPDFQRSGIGSALITAGMDQMKGAGARGIAVVGNPAYYERFGFAVIPGLNPLSQHDVPYFRAIALIAEAPQGTLGYARAFG